jgi:hypothetical protein
MKLAGQDLKSLEISDSASPSSNFFVDSASPAALATCLGVLCVLIFVHIAAATQTPSIIDFKEQSMPLEEGDPNASVEVDIVLSQLDSMHRILDINCTLLRNRPADHTVHLDLVVFVKAIFLSNSSVVNTVKSRPDRLSVSFAEDARRSSPFSIVRKEVIGFDSLQLKLTMLSHFDQIEGLLFRWSFANPAAAKYFRAVRLLLSVLVGYMLLVYVSFLTWDDRDFFTQIFCIALGVFGILAANPVSTLPGASAPHIVDHLLAAVYAAALRLFFLLQLEMIRAGAAAPRTDVAAGLSVPFVLYAVVEAAAAFDRAQLVAGGAIDVIFQTERALAYFHRVYIAALAVWAVVAYRRKRARTRLFVFVAFAAAGIAATVLAQTAIGADGMQSVTPALVYTTVHVTTGAFTIFLMHSQGRKKYVEIEDDVHIEVMVDQDEDQTETSEEDWMDIE